MIESKMQTQQVLVLSWCMVTPHTCCRVIPSQAQMWSSHLESRSWDETSHLTVQQKTVSTAPDVTVREFCMSYSHLIVIQQLQGNETGSCRCSVSLKRIIWHFGKYAYSLFPDRYCTWVNKLLLCLWVNLRLQFRLAEAPEQNYTVLQESFRMLYFSSK